jgi:hypothetical protein
MFTRIQSHAIVVLSLGLVPIGSPLLTGGARAAGPVPTPAGLPR